MACMQVNAPLGKVFEVWRERGNYAEWFDLIGQVNKLLVLQLSRSHCPPVLHVDKCIAALISRTISTFFESLRPVHECQSVREGDC